MTHFRPLIKFYTTRWHDVLEKEEDQALIFLHPNHLINRPRYSYEKAREHPLSRCRKIMEIQQQAYTLLKYKVLSLWFCLTDTTFHLHVTQFKLKQSSLVNCLQVATFGVALRHRFPRRILHLLSVLRYFDIVFQRPYWYFSTAWKVILFLSDRYEIFNFGDLFASKNSALQQKSR